MVDQKTGPLVDEKTDKYVNKLTQVYESSFRELLHLPVRILELGIFRGGSLEYWDALFKNTGAQIIGVDLRIPQLNCSSRVVTYQCDQNDREGLLRIARAHGPFHVIIDDASHMPNETRGCFDLLYPHVVPGGFYGIEDWGVGYWGDRLPEYRGMVEVITDIVRDVPRLNIRSFSIVADAGCLALFRKDTVAFATKPVPPGIAAAEEYYRKMVKSDMSPL